MNRLSVSRFGTGSVDQGATDQGATDQSSTNQSSSKIGFRLSRCVAVLGLLVTPSLQSPSIKADEPSSPETEGVFELAMYEPANFREYLAMGIAAEDAKTPLGNEKAKSKEAAADLKDRDRDSDDKTKRSDRNLDDKKAGDKKVADNKSADADKDKQNAKKKAKQKESIVRAAEVVEGRFQLPSLAAVSTLTTEIGNGRVPDSFRSTENSVAMPLPESASQRMQSLDAATWQWTRRTWTAPDTYSNPRYFEDVMLERHGHERWGHSQALFSGARFFVTAPMLPYLMAIQHPCDCESTLGYHRSGSCSPAYFQRPPYDRKAMVAESATIATGLWILP
jgi:hypothetical protein